MNKQYIHNGTIIGGTVDLSGSLKLSGIIQSSTPHILTYDTASGQIYYTASSAIGGGGSGTPGGSDTQIQFNSGGLFAGDSVFRYEYNSQSLVLGAGTTQASGIYSVAFGENAIAFGAESFAHGENVVAYEATTHAEGINTTASGAYSHAEGDGTLTIGGSSHAEGSNTRTGIQNAFSASIVNGVVTLESGSDYSTEFTIDNELLVYNVSNENIFLYKISQSNYVSPNTIIRLYNTTVNVTNAYIGDHTSGMESYSDVPFDMWVGDKTIEGFYAHAEGQGSLAANVGSHAEGYLSVAIGKRSHAEGEEAEAIGNASHAEGSNTQAIGVTSHTEGESTQAIGVSSHAEGNQTIASGSYSHAEGHMTLAQNIGDHSEGSLTKAIGGYSHAEGYMTIASQNYSHAEGFAAIASGTYAHAEGRETKAIGGYSHSEGWNTEAIGDGSHAEGLHSKAILPHSHAEGLQTYALGSHAHTEGAYTKAFGFASHTEGGSTLTKGDYTHAEGAGTMAGIGRQVYVIKEKTSPFAPNAGVIIYGNHTASLFAGMGFLNPESGYSSNIEGFNITGSNTFLTASWMTGGSVEGNLYAVDVTQSISPESYAHSEGSYTDAIGEGSHAEGLLTKAISRYSHAEGWYTKTGTDNAYSASITSGIITISSEHGNITSSFSPNEIMYINDYGFDGSYETGQTFLISQSYFSSPNTIVTLYNTGINTNIVYVGNANIPPIQWLGTYTIRNIKYSHTEGKGTIALGEYAHAEGTNTAAIGQSSHAEGEKTKAIGTYSHAEGYESLAIGDWSHAEGMSAKALNGYSHAEGQLTRAMGLYSHAEGNSTIASGSFSHAEGDGTEARGEYSHTEGAGTIAIGDGSHAEGLYTETHGRWSHAAGRRTRTDADFQMVVGIANATSSIENAFIIGNGVVDPMDGFVTTASNLLVAYGSQVEITGSLYATDEIHITNALKLVSSNPLPAGGLGKLAVSGSSLYFHDGDNWRTVSLV